MQLSCRRIRVGVCGYARFRVRTYFFHRALASFEFHTHMCMHTYVMLEPQLFAWKMTEDDNMTEADNETTTLRLLGFSFQSFVSVPTAEHFNRVSNSVNIDMEIDTFPYSFWSNIPTYLNATSLSSFHGVLAPAYDFGRTTGDVPSSSTFFPLNGYPFSIPMTSLLAYIDTFSNEHWETIISNNSDYSEVRMIAPCGVIPGEAALWSKIDLSDPSSEANFTGNFCFSKWICRIWT